MMQLTPFEQILEALLEDGHEIHFKKENGTIFFTLNDDTVNMSAAPTLEQIGQLVIGSAVSQAFKRIDGGSCTDVWHQCKAKLDDCPTCGAKSDWQGRE